MSAVLRFLATLLRSRDAAGTALVPTARSETDPGENPPYAEAYPEVSEAEREAENEAHKRQQRARSELPKARADLEAAEMEAVDLPVLRDQVLDLRLSRYKATAWALALWACEALSLGPVVADLTGIDLDHLDGAGPARLAGAIALVVGASVLLFELARASLHAVSSDVPATPILVAFAVAALVIATLRSGVEGAGMRWALQLFNVGVTLAFALAAARSKRRTDRFGNELRPLRTELRRQESKLAYTRKRVADLEGEEVAMGRIRAAIRRLFDATAETVAAMRRREILNAYAPEEVATQLAQGIRRYGAYVLAIVLLALLGYFLSGCSGNTQTSGPISVTVLLDASGSQAACAPECDQNPLPEIWDAVAEATALPAGLHVEARLITKDAGAPLLAAFDVPEAWESGKSVTAQKAALRGQGHDVFAAVKPEAGEAGNGVLGGLWSSGRNLAERPMGTHWLIVASDLRACYPDERRPSRCRWYFGAERAPNATEVIAQAQADHRLPDLHNVDRVIACNVHAAPEAGHTWSPARHTEQLELWAELFAQMGARNTRLLASCDSKNLAAYLKE